MSVADATRFDMLKKPATAAMSQMSRSEKPDAAQRLAVLLLDAPGLGGELDGEVEHGALALASGARRDSSSPSVRRAPDRRTARAPRRRARPGSSSSGSATTPRPRSSRARAWTGPTAPASGRCTWRRRLRAWRCRRRRPCSTFGTKPSFSSHLREIGGHCRRERRRRQRERGDLGVIVSRCAGARSGRGAVGGGGSAVALGHEDRFQVVPADALSCCRRRH